MLAGSLLFAVNVVVYMNSADRTHQQEIVAQVTPDSLPVLLQRTDQMRLTSGTNNSIRHSSRLILQLPQIIQRVHQLRLKYDRRTLSSPPIIQPLLATPPALRRYVTASTVHTHTGAPVGVEPVIAQLAGSKHFDEFVPNIMDSAEEPVEIFSSKNGTVGLAVCEVVRPFGFGTMDAREVIEGGGQDAWNVTLAAEADSKS